jgi:hypothetical protein
MRGPATTGSFCAPGPHDQMKAYLAHFGIAVAAGLVVELLLRVFAG